MVGDAGSTTGAFWFIVYAENLPHFYFRSIMHTDLESVSLMLLPWR